MTNLELEKELKKYKKIVDDAYKILDGTRILVKEALRIAEQSDERMQIAKRYEDPKGAQVELLKDIIIAISKTSKKE